MTSTSRCSRRWRRSRTRRGRRSSARWADGGRGAMRPWRRVAVAPCGCGAMWLCGCVAVAPCG
eukprot:4687986-Prymnesium_polylepis.1